MTSKRQKKPSEMSATTGGYGDLLAGIKQRIATSQVRAHLAVSRELNFLYWQIGRDIVERQKTEKWGKSVVERLAADIQKAFPGIEGFSGLNVWRMRAFFLAWQVPDPILSQAATELKAPPAAPFSSEFLSQPATEIDPSVSSPILAQPATELPPSDILSIPWFHNVIIIQKIKDPANYGQKLLESVAADLAKKEIKGLTDPRVLRDCRVLYRVYPQIRGSVTREFPTPLTLQELMRLSWTHLQELFVSRYLVALPSVEKLRSFLETDRERIESLMPPPVARKCAARKPKN